MNSASKTTNNQGNREKSIKGFQKCETDTSNKILSFCHEIFSPPDAVLLYFPNVEFNKVNLEIREKR